MTAKIVVFSLLIGVFTFFSVAKAGEIRYDKGAEQRDPFVPLMDAQRVGMMGNDAISIEGIIYDPKGSSYAIIGGEIYREGEDIEGARLVKINSDRVIFLQENQETIIWLREEIIAPDAQKEKAPSEDE